MRTFIVGAGVAIAVTLASSLIAVAGQGPSSAPKPAQKDKPARTSWGAPDLQGIWSNATTTPLERPAQMAAKDVLTDEERTALDARAAQNADRPPRPGDTGAYNSFWLETGLASNRTSLIVDPPDGKLPPSRRRRKEGKTRWRPLAGSLPVRGRI